MSVTWTWPLLGMAIRCRQPGPFGLPPRLVWVRTAGSVGQRAPVVRPRLVQDDPGTQAQTSMAIFFTYFQTMWAISNIEVGVFGYVDPYNAGNLHPDVRQHFPTLPFPIQGTIG